MGYRIKDPDKHKNIKIIEKQDEKKNKCRTYVESIGASTLHCCLPKNLQFALNKNINMSFVLTVSIHAIRHIVEQK